MIIGKLVVTRKSTLEKVKEISSKKTGRYYEERTKDVIESYKKLKEEKLELERLYTKSQEQIAVLNARQKELEELINIQDSSNISKYEKMLETILE